MALRKIGLLALLVYSIFAGGCIREDPKECPEESFALVFFYPGNGTTDIFPARIEQVELFVYDSDGAQVQSSSFTKSELELYQGARLELPDGNYTVVCWANMARYSEFTQTDPISDARLYQSQFLSQTTIGDFDPLYFGRREITVGGDLDATDTLTFASAHINIEVHIQGYEGRISTRGQGQGVVQLENISVGYDFSMSLTPESGVMYPLWETDDKTEEIYASFRLLRFDNDNDIVLHIFDSDGGTVIGSMSLSDFLRENGISVEGVNEVTIPVYIIFDEFGMKVAIDPWDTTGVIPIPRS